jgi:hypothetical protein
MNDGMDAWMDEKLHEKRPRRPLLYVLCLKAKEELWKLKYFTMQKYIIFKNSSKRNQNFVQAIITL